MAMFAKITLLAVTASTLVVVLAMRRRRRRQKRRRMMVVKIGGAAITEKGRKHTVKATELEGCLDAVASAEKEIIVIHGAGSFGHFEAAEIRASNFATAFAATRRAVTRLNRIIVDGLCDRGVPAVTISPFACDDLVGHLREALERGLCPVTHGDALLTTHGHRILSGDDIAAAIAPAAERVIFVTDVDGVYDHDPRHFSNAVLFPTISRRDTVVITGAGDDDRVDVTGGMRGKLRAAFTIAQTTPVRVLGPKALVRALRADLVTEFSSPTSSDLGTLIVSSLPSS